MKNTKPCPRPSGLLFLATLVVLLTWFSIGLAEPLHTPTIDGVIAGNGVDWATADLVVDDSHDDDAVETVNIRRLWCTWDADNLYVAVTYQDFSDTAALTVYLDLDRGIGPNDASELDTYSGQFVMPEDHRFELVLGRNRSDGNNATLTPQPLLVVDDDGTTIDLSGEVTIAQAQSFEFPEPDKNRLPFWLNTEFAIPWASIYPDAEGTVPPYAVIKAVAFITLGLPDKNGIDSAPDNEGLDWSDTPVTLHNLHASVVDADGDGTPDPCDATISGTIDLPNDDGARILEISARMLDFPGRDPVAILSSYIGAPGTTTYAVPRLAAGDYELTFRSDGYISTTMNATVTESQQLTGFDLSLVKAASISGDITFATREGGPGTISLLTSSGAFVDSLGFSEDGLSYTFYMEEGGDFQLAVSAETYLDAQTSFTIQTSEDLVDVDFDLISQTMLSGSVDFVDGPGAAGTVLFMDAAGDTLDQSSFAFTGADFQFFTPVGGEFKVSSKAPTYVRTDSTVTVVAGNDISGIDLVMPRSALISATLGFEGPTSNGNLIITNQATSQVMDEVSFETNDDPYEVFLDPGLYQLSLTADGYVPQIDEITVGLDDMDLGLRQLIAVRATTLALIENDEVVSETRVIFYDPDVDPWTAGRVQLVAQDDNGLKDLFDLDGRLTDFRLSSRKMDDVSPPNGDPRFYRSESETDTSTVVNFQQGEADFWTSNTAVEVLRIYLAQPNKEPIAGRIVVAFQDPRPTYVVLTSERDTLVADNNDAIRISARLYDSAYEESPTADVPVTFSVANSSSGIGGFEVVTVLTNADGLALADVTATGSGSLNITCSVVIENRTLEVLGGSLDSDDDFLPLVAVAGPTAAWELGLLATLGDLVNPVAVTAQLVDQFGNPTKDQDLSFTFDSDPADLGSFNPATAVTDTNGRAEANFIPSGTAGMVTISGSGNGFNSDEVNLSLHALQVLPDAIWYNEPRTRQTFPAADLTALILDNTPDALLLDIPFNSNWNGLQLHVLLETNFDAEGATSDPFTMPVTYGHTNKPDYVLTTKYSANDYGDFRRWNNGAYEFWIVEYDNQGNPTENGEYTTGGDGQSIQEAWTTKSGAGMKIRIPWTAFGDSPPDSMRLECYLTQEDDGTKRSAFDSAPQDSTLNLTFDWENPEDGDWDQATTAVTLLHYGDTYITKTDFPTPPVISNVTAQPTEIVAGELFILTAEITSGGDGVGDVLANMTALGGSALTRLYDDGNENHGDLTADDGVYSLRLVVPWGNPGGEKSISVLAYDASNASTESASTEVQITANIEPILIVSDPVGDDHGPNQNGSANKFYTYPTNSAFVPGSFDLTGLTIYETTVDIGGEDVDMIAFQVSLGDFPDPTDAGTASWNPLYADLNIEKIDILIDSAPGGATATLPMRQAGFQRWDAWDFAIVMDGWYKALIPSLGHNTLDAWRNNALRTDRDIMLVGDPDLDVVTAFVSKAALGNPTTEDILSWDMVVTIAGHDFGGEEVLGGCRWVNESRSEWQFGGGKNEDRDSNLMDIILVPGSSHTAGLSQEEILDYESVAALQRLEDGETPVAIEMTQFEDTGPPVIDTGGAGSVVTEISPIEDAPLAMTVGITDDFRVESATFRYRSTGFVGEGWDRQVDMGYLGRDRWVVDILPSWLDSNLVYSPVDSTRYLEFEVFAVDPLGKESTSPVTTLQIWPNRLCRPQDSTLESENTSLLQVDGSTLLLPEKTRLQLISRHLAEAWTGAEVDADTMGSAVELLWDICDVPEAIKSAPSVPAGEPLGVFRNVFLATSDSLGGYVDYPEELPAKVELSLHYPQAWIDEGLDENKIALYEYNMTSNRWVLAGGNVTPTGNNVTATVTRTGTFGLFYAESLNYDSNEVISGITISPNPFSPNGDDLYDETTISFFLTQEATVTVEIYNIQGHRKMVLTEAFPFAGSDQDDRTPRRVPGLIWDGREFNGDLVPYGVYVLRITATYNQAGGTRSIRSNHSLAVIR